MNSRLLKLAILLSIAFPVALHGQGLAVPVANATSTGTTVNTLTKLNTTAGAISGVITATTDTGGAIGVCTSGCGTSGTASIAIWGVVPCAFDGTATANDWVQISTSTGGDCHDTGSSTAPTSGELLGRVFTGGAGAGLYSLIINKDIYPVTASQLALTGHNVTAPLVCSDTSASGTAQSCTTSPTFTPTTDDCVIYTTTTTNSGAGLTTNVNALGAKSVAIPGSSGWTTTLTASIVPANKPLLACYDGTNWNVQQTGTSASGGGGLPTGTTGQTVYYASGGTTGTATSALTVTSAAATGNVGFDNTAPVATLDHIGAESHLGIANVNTTLNGSITATSASLTLTSGTGWPAAGGYAVIMAATGGGTPEWICFSAVSGTTMTIGGGNCLTPVTTSGRSYFGTTAATHASGAAIYLVESLNQVSATTSPTFWVMNGTYFFNLPATDIHMNQYGANVVVVGSGAGFGPSVTALNGIVPGGFGAIQIISNGASVSFLNGNGNPLWVSAPTVLASNTTITSASFVTTGVSIAVQGSASVHGRCVIAYGTASAGTIQFGLVTSAAPTRLDVFALDSTGAASTPFNALGITTATTTTISGLDTAATVTSGNFSFDFIVNANNTANTLTVDALTTAGAGNTLTIDRSSYCTFN